MILAQLNVRWIYLLCLLVPTYYNIIFQNDSETETISTAMIVLPYFLFFVLRIRSSIPLGLPSESKSCSAVWPCQKDFDISFLTRDSSLYFAISLARRLADLLTKYQRHRPTIDTIMITIHNQPTVSPDQYIAKVGIPIAKAQLVKSLSIFLDILII